MVERTQAGDNEAFAQIYDRYFDAVFRFVYFRVGNRQLAEDLTADTFLRALKRIDSFTWQGRDLGAWLVTIARNLVADHFRSARYRLEIATGDVLDAEHATSDPDSSPETTVLDRISNESLLHAIKQLQPEQQRCVELRFLRGFSIAETAQAMGKPEGAIKALQYRAVRAVARLLPDDFHPGGPTGTVYVPTERINPPAPRRADPPAVPEPTPRKAESPEEGARAEDLSSRVNALPERQREVYRMITEEGKNAAEVARLTGLAQSTVRVHLLRANRALAAPPPEPRPQQPHRKRRIRPDFSAVDTSQKNLMRLPKRQRDVVRRILNGRSYSQVADELGITATTVRVHSSKAIRTLTAAKVFTVAGGDYAGQDRLAMVPGGSTGTTAIRPTSVEVETSLRLVAPDATGLPVRANLRYYPEDPHAVHVLFHAETAFGEPVGWSFPRELLATGLDEPAGTGDVRVWPWASTRGHFVALALSSPDGNALFEVPRSVLVRFLRRTYIAVPRGGELKACLSMTAAACP